MKYAVELNEFGNPIIVPSNVAPKDKGCAYCEDYAAVVMQKQRVCRQCAQKMIDLGLCEAKKMIKLLT